VQPISDLLLGWTTIGHHHYLVRQLNDHKGRIDLAKLDGLGLGALAMVAGELLARGHARSGDACAIRGYSGSGMKMAKALRDFACEYADQTEADYRAFLSAIKAGTMKVASATG
jgi:predicted alpha/beta hydrolase